MAYYQREKITYGELPKSHHNDDKGWINTMLAPLQQDERCKVCVAYSNVFDSAFTEEKLPHRKDGKARFAANNRLRIYINKKFAVFNK